MLKIHIFRSVYLHSLSTCHMTLTHHLSWNLNKFEHLWTTSGQVSTGWFKPVCTSGVIRNGRVWLMNNPRYPLFPFFDRFQMENSFAWTAKTTLDHLWKLGVYHPWLYLFWMTHSLFLTTMGTSMMMVISRDIFHL